MTQIVKLDAKVMGMTHVNAYLLDHSRPENFKKSRPKQLMKSNKSISRIFFNQIPFLLYQKRPKINFCTGKKFKTAKNVISRKKFFDLFDFTNFFVSTF